jgi:hypothetical protein
MKPTEVREIAQKVIVDLCLSHLPVEEDKILFCLNSQNHKAKADLLEWLIMTLVFGKDSRMESLGKKETPISYEYQ